MTQDILGSKEKAKNGFGQNGYQGASSLTPGQTKPNIPDVSPPSVVLTDHRGADLIGDRVHGAPVPHMNNEHPRTSSSGSPGGTVPGNNRPVKK